MLAVASTLPRRARLGLLPLGAAAILGTLLLVACGDPPAAAPAPRQETAGQQPALRPRVASLAAAITPLTAQPPPAALPTPQARSGSQPTKPTPQAPAPSPAMAAKSPPTQAESSATPVTPQSSQAPAPMARATLGSSNFVQVTVGENHSCALQEDGRAVCWGETNERQLNVPDGMRFRQLSAGSRFTCGLRIDGGITCWGENDHQQINAPDGHFTAVDAGWDHACALSRDGATCWGWNANGRATPPEGSFFTAVDAGAEHSCGLTVGGDLVCWGSNDDGRSDSRAGPFKALAVGWTHTCVLRDNGTAICQGSNTEGQSDPPNTTFTDISAGSEHTCGLRPTHNIECWGAHSRDLAVNVRLAAPPGPFTAISAGWTRTCAVTANGHAQCWNFTYDFLPLSPYGRLNFANFSVGYILASPVEVFSWPNGGLAVANKEGFITLFDHVSEPNIILDLRDKTFSDSLESGMLSAAVDPEFRRFPFLYVYYSLRIEEESDKAIVRLSRFPVENGQVNRDLELVILDIPRQKEKTPALWRCDTLWSGRHVVSGPRRQHLFRMPAKSKRAAWQDHSD